MQTSHDPFEESLDQFPSCDDSGKLDALDSCLMKTALRRPEVLLEQASLTLEARIQFLGDLLAKLRQALMSLLGPSALVDPRPMYAKNHLRQLKAEDALEKAMSPDLLSNYSEGFVAYRRDQVRVWRSSYRENLTTRETNEILATYLQKLPPDLKSKPPLPREATRLAQNLEPASEDYYTQVVKGTAEGRTEQARALYWSRHHLESSLNQL